MSIETNKRRDDIDDQLHVLFFPFMAEGHLRPAIDMAKLFASRGQRSTVITTSHFAQSLSRSLRRAGIDFVTVTIPCSEVGLPDGTESFHMIKGLERDKFVAAMEFLAPQLDALLQQHQPDCLVADILFPWATSVAAGHGVPRLVFHGTSYFSLCAALAVFLHRPEECASSGSESFVIPCLPDEVVFTPDKVQDLPKGSASLKVYDESKKVELESHGVLVNSFYELESSYPRCYTKVLGVNKSWHIGPLFLYNEGGMDEDYVDEHGCLKWLDTKKPGSVVYICFGSLGTLRDTQLTEIAAGLEASGKDFVWVVTKEKGTDEWLPRGFEERMEGRGLIIRGWAPQVRILDHESVGTFVTHCGWNSTLESVCSGKPMVTWPFNAEQFYNEKLVSQVLGIGVEIGVTKWSLTGGDFVRREVVESAVRRVTDGEHAEGMRDRAKKLAEMARMAVKEGGSSWLQLNAFFQDLRSRKLARH